MYMLFWQRWSDFSGRSRRREYWGAILWNSIIGMVLGILDWLFFGPYPILGGIFFLLSFVPSIAISLRRLHDIGRSGWWLFIVLVPIIGALVFVIFTFQDSEPRTNRYGPSSKYNYDSSVTERMSPPPYNR